MICWANPGSLIFPLKPENLTVSFYYVSFTVLPEICPLCLQCLDCKLLLHRAEMAKWKLTEKKKKSFSCQSRNMVLLQYFTISKIMRCKMPELVTEPRNNAAIKSSASGLVPLGTSYLNICTLKLNFRRSSDIP